MKTIALFSASLLALVGLNACYTPRDVRPAAVAEAKAISERDLPRLAESLPRGNRSAAIARLERYLKNHPGVYGAAFAPVPAGGPAIYVYRHRGGFATRELAPPAYDYARMEWYRQPIQRGTAVWSAPYFDEDGGDVWMQTYSLPVSGGVLTNDVPVYGPRAD